MPPEQIEQSSPTGNKKALISFVVLILIGLGGWASYAFYSKSALTTEEVLVSAIKNDLELKSGTLDVRMSMDLSELVKDAPEEAQFFLGLGLTNIAVNIKGAYDYRDLVNSKYDLNIEAESGMFSVSGGLRLMDKNGYVRLGKVPAVAEEMARDFTDKWFSFPIESEELKESLQGLTEEEKNFIYATSVNDKSIKIIEVLPPETINGDLSYHYSFTMDLVELKAYIIKIGEYLNTTNSSDEGAPFFDAVSFGKEFEAVKKIDGSMWISKDDKYLNKIVLNIDISPDLEKVEVMKINFTGTFGDFNKPVTIVAPAESVPFEEVFGDMFAPAQEGELEVELE